MDGGAFISYRREDAAGFAGRLCDSLERLLPNEPVFRDVDGLSPGQDFVTAIDTRLRQCRVCLAVIGRDWLNARDADGRRRLDRPDDFVRLELMAALARKEVLIIPVLVEGRRCRRPTPCLLRFARSPAGRPWLSATTPGTPTWLAWCSRFNRPWRRRLASRRGRRCRSG
jgi:hypothetical protein